MPQVKLRQSILEFSTYPPVGDDDWRYAFGAARVRALETQMLPHATFQDMANAQSFENAVDMLSAGQYAVPKGAGFAGIEEVLVQMRAAARELFANLMIDESIVELFKSRDDFANLRLALRRVLTDKPVGADYSPSGNVAPEVLEHAFTEENYAVLPGYVRRAAEAATINYYQDKDIRRIDYEIDRLQALHNINEARRLDSVFLDGLFRTRVDLTNIRTLLRLKFTESEQIDVFLDGGFLEPAFYKHGLDLGYEAIGNLFFATPYQHLVEAGAGYLASNKSFLKTEGQCDRHLIGLLKSTAQITAGPQPIIAYLLMKEHEIRTIRLVLTAKKNSLDTRLILDRIA